MNILSPLELLSKELITFQRALDKSRELFQEEKISTDVHLGHKRNLTKLIKDYETAISKLIE